MSATSGFPVTIRPLRAERADGADVPGPGKGGLQRRSALLDEEPRHKAGRFEVLSRFAGCLMQRPDLEGVLQTVCDETARSMGVAVTVLSFYDPVTRTFRHGAASGIVSVSRRFVPVPRSALDLLVAEPGTVVVIPDLRRDQEAKEIALFGELGLRSVAVAALLEGSNLLGCLSVATLDRPRTFAEEETALLLGLAGLAALAVSNAQLLQASQRKVQRTELVASMAQALSIAGTDFRSLFATAVRRTGELLDGACVLALLSEDDQQLEVVASHDPDGSGLEPGTLPAGVSDPGATRGAIALAAQVVETGRPLFIPNSGEGSRTEGPVPDYQTRIGLSRSRSLLIVPLQAQGKAIGTLGLSRERGKELFTHEDQEFLSELADRAAIAVTNARLYEEARARTEELSTLLSLATRLRKAQSPGELLPLALGEILSLVGAAGAAAALWEEEASRFRLVRGVGHLEACTGSLVAEDEGAYGAVRRTGLPQVLPVPFEGSGLPAGCPLVPGTGSQAFIPLQSEAGFLGVLVVVRLKAPSPRGFSRAEVRLLATCGEMVGNALRRMLLFEDAQRRLKFAEGLRRIDMAIIGTTDARIPLQVVLGELRSLLGVEAADVLLHDPRFHSLSYASGFGLRTPALQHTVLRVGEGLAGRAALERRTVRVADLGAERECLPRDAILTAEGFVSYLGLPLVSRGQVLGVLEVLHRTPFEPAPEWLEALDVLAGQASLAIDNASMFDRLQRSRLDLELAYDETIEGWSRALDLRDDETEGHTQRVKTMTLRLARAMGFPDDELLQIQRGALLHDIGKMGVPDEILLKPGPLTEEEWLVMRRHPQLACDLLSPIAYLKQAIDIPYAHHEKWDGTGYPRGRKGLQIPRAARAFAVVDVWDALRSDRPYRAGWPEERVMAHIQSLSGTHFDPEVVEVFLKVCRQ